MSQFGGHGATKGPYGPNNPPPPPKDPPPTGKASQKRRYSETIEPSSLLGEMPSPRESEKPRRRTTANQRRKLRLDKERAELEKEKAQLAQNKESRRSRSPSREGGRGRSERRREGWSQQSRSREDQRGRRWGPLHDRRQPLQDARQVTPDQIMDETYGRLSPGTGDRDQYVMPHDDAQRQLDRQDGWADERSRSPRRRQPSNRYSGGNGEANRFDEHYVQNHIEMPHDNRHNSPVAGSSHSYNREDEVVWDDEEEAVNVSAHVRPSSTFNIAETISSTYPPAQPQPWQQRPWQGKDRKAQQNRFQPYQGKKNGQKSFQAKSQFGKPYDNGHGPAGSKYQPGRAPKKEANTQATAEDRLLQDDPSLMAELKPKPNIPDTVCDLRVYDAEVTALQKTLPRHERFINGNGKVAPYIYGSIQGQDLGLCFSTFCTIFRCEMGVKCAWRHHPLTKAEREWIIKYGRERGKQFLEKVGGFWANPEVPVPGANMHEK